MLLFLWTTGEHSRKMPRLKSAIKRVKTAKRNWLRNLTYHSKIKTLIKKVQTLVSSKDTDNAKKAANEAFSEIDRASTKNIIHLNNAKRKKSKISKWLKTLETKQSK